MVYKHDQTNNNRIRLCLKSHGSSQITFYVQWCWQSMVFRVMIRSKLMHPFERQPWCQMPTPPCTNKSDHQYSMIKVFLFRDFFVCYWSFFNSFCCCGTPCQRFLSFAQSSIMVFENDLHDIIHVFLKQRSHNFFKFF